MKTSKIFFLTLSALFLIITPILVSCDKENDLSEPEKAIILKSEEPVMRTLYEMPDPQNPYECDYPASNCLPTTTITPRVAKSFSDLEMVYTDFTSKYKSNKINDFFKKKSDYLALFPALANMPDVVKGLQNSEIILYHSFGTGGLDYYIGLSKNTNFSSKWFGQQKCVFVIDNQLQ